MKPFSKLIPIVKVQDGPNGLAIAYGLATSEAIDSEMERCDYAGTKPYYQKWAEDAAKSTTAAGQEMSCGNIRIMHGSEVGGKAIGIDFDDNRKQVWIKTEAKDAAISDQLRRGIYAAFSQGGRYVSRIHKDCGGNITDRTWCAACQKNADVVDYVAEITEVSYVDLPANPEAKFTYVKADGSIEFRKFAEPKSLVINAELAKHIRVLPAITEEQCRAAARGEDPKLTDEQKAAFESLTKSGKTKRVAGEDLPCSAFAYCGDPDKTDTWKLPIKFSTDAKTVRHIRNALARFSSTRGIPAEKKSDVKAKIVAAAKAHGIEVADSEKIARFVEESVNKASQAGLKKDMYDVSRFADLVSSMASLWSYAEYEAEYEGDGSTIPAELRDLVDMMSDALVAMCIEETAELTAKKAAESAVTKSAAPAATEEKMNEEIMKAMKSRMAGFCKGMSRVEKSRAAICEKTGPSHATMAESHKVQAERAAALHKSAVDAAAVAGITAEVKAAHETEAEAHKAIADHHTAAQAHHTLKSLQAAEMQKAHAAAAVTFEKMAEAQSDTETAKAAGADLEKMAGPETAIVPSMAEVVAQAVSQTMAAVTEVHKAQMTEMQKSFKDQSDVLTTQISALKDQVEKKTDPAIPGKLFRVPLPGLQKKSDDDKEPALESGRIAI